MVRRDGPRIACDRVKILFLAVNDGNGDLKLDEEYRALDAIASRRDQQLDLESKWAVRRSELQQGLLQHEPAIVHFGGHGTAAGELMLRDEAAQLAPVSADALASLFGVLRGNVQLVVLNACFSAVQATAIRDSIGLAIGMRRQISDRAAIAFSTAFYEALSYRRSVLDAFELGVTAIKTQDLAGEADIPELLARDDLDPRDVYLLAPATASDASTGDHTERTGASGRLGLIALVIASLGLAVLIGLGTPGRITLTAYAIYVALGGLSTAITWRILSRTDRFKRSRYCIHIRITCSLLPLIAIVGGSLWLRASKLPPQDVLSSRVLPVGPTSAVAPTIAITYPRPNQNVEPGFTIDVKVDGVVSAVTLTVDQQVTRIPAPGPYRFRTDPTLTGDQDLTITAIAPGVPDVTEHLRVHVKSAVCRLSVADVYAAPIRTRNQRCPRGCIDSGSRKATKAVPQAAFDTCVKVCLCE